MFRRSRRRTEEAEEEEDKRGKEELYEVMRWVGTVGEA